MLSDGFLLCLSSIGGPGKFCTDREVDLDKHGTNLPWCPGDTGSSGKLINYKKYVLKTLTG